MIIDCIADLHGHYPKLEGGDLLIVAGDLTASDTPEQYGEFLIWAIARAQKQYKKVIFIAGNHDNFIYDRRKFHAFQHESLNYLCDSGTEFKGLKIWGSPWTNQFPGINRKCCAFTRPFMESLEDRWNMIPSDTDILITHTPPHGIFDSIETEYKAHVGDKDLRETVIRRIKPKMHVFGHIHEHGGKCIDTVVTKFVNASLVNEHYQPVNKPVRIVL